MSRHPSSNRTRRFFDSESENAGRRGRKTFRSPLVEFNLPLLVRLDSNCRLAFVVDESVIDIEVACSIEMTGMLGEMNSRHGLRGGLTGTWRVAVRLSCKNR